MGGGEHRVTTPSVAIVRIGICTSDIVIGRGLYIVHETGRRQWSGVA